MYEAKLVKPDIYWVGSTDWNSRDFDGEYIEHGTTYNAYLILDEKVTLVDATHPGFEEELLGRIASVIDPSEIEYVISCHGELDHSSAITAVLEKAPNAKVVTSDPQGVKSLKGNVSSDLDLVPVKTGDTLNIGKRTLEFVQTVMVHWPDNMVVYSSYDKVLFSNDAFGQHYATSELFDDQIGLETVLQAAQKYYACIITPYSAQAAKALEAVKTLDIDMIATGHGLIWRSYIKDIIEAYERWTHLESKNEAVVVYDSMYGVTEKLALQLIETFSRNGVKAWLFDLKVNHIADIMPYVLTSKYIAVGSPTLNNGMMPNVAAFLCFMKGLSPKNRIGIPFGSYGWSQAGQNAVAQELEASKFTLDFGTFSYNWDVTDEQLKDLDEKVTAGIKACQEE